MRTVQETIKMLDRKDLIEVFAQRMGTRFLELKCEGSGQMTYSKLKKAYRRSIGSFLDDLLELTPRASDDGRIGIIFAFPDLERYEIRHELIFEDELRKNHEATEGYAYSFTDWDEVMGFLVADNRFSQEHIYELMAEVMYEITWNGFSWEDMKKYREKTYKSMDKMFGSEEWSEGREENVEPEPSIHIGLNERLDQLKEITEKVRANKKCCRELYDAAGMIYYEYLRGRELERVLSSLPSSKIKVNRGNQTND